MREPISVVTLHQDFCQHVFSVGTCDATGEPCFNTRSTCKDRANYSLGTPLPIKFVSNRSPQLRDGYYIPSLESVRVGAAKINPGGANKSASALGQRATIAVRFNDHPHNDKLVDPYRADRDYDPLTRGSFWSKWRARNMFYLHRLITFQTGYFEDGAIVDSVTRSFVVTDFSGPDSNGNVEIRGKDLLTLAENSKAQAPRVSTGKLVAAVTNVAGSGTLTPAGIGALDYPASGSIRIEKEIITFTRSGDVLTFTTRGTQGTTAAAHDAGATVQLCLVYTSQSPQAILNDLLTNYAGIAAGNLDTAQWTAETLDYLPRLYSAFIAEPEGVATLIGEMCEQMYFTVWFDERDNKVKIRAVRTAADEEITELNDNAHLLQDSVSWRDLTDQIVSQSWIHYGQINPTQKLDEAANYAAVEVYANLESEDAKQNNSQNIKKIFSRWISAGNAAAAVDLGDRINRRYSNAPRECSFQLDAKDRAIWLSSFVRLTNRLNVDIYGSATPADLQVYQAEEIEVGTRFGYVAQEFTPPLESEVIDSNARSVIISADMLNLDLRALYESQLGAPAGTEIVTFTIRAGVTIGGDTAGGGSNVLAASRTATNDFYDAGSANLSGNAIGQVPILQRDGINALRTTAANAAYALGGVANWIINERPLSVALKTGSWPAGVTLNLVVESTARILGEGGNGAAHALKETTTHSASGIVYNNTPRGGDGGHALQIDKAINITNNGVIAGGGGGGAGLVRDYSSGNTMLAAGAGGDGFRVSDVCQNVIVIGYGNGYYTPITTNAERGQAKTSSGRAQGATLLLQNATTNKHAVNRSANNTSTNATKYGLGGLVGNPGAQCTYVWAYSSFTGYKWAFTSGTGGLAGRAINDGVELVTWINKGDVRGTEL